MRERQEGGIRKERGKEGRGREREEEGETGREGMLTAYMYIYIY